MSTRSGGSQPILLRRLEYASRLSMACRPHLPAHAGRHNGTINCGPRHAGAPPGGWAGLVYRLEVAHEHLEPRPKGLQTFKHHSVTLRGVVVRARVPGQPMRTPRATHGAGRDQHAAARPA